MSKWKKWCRLLSTTYYREIQKSFTAEKVDAEYFVLFQLKGKTYGIALLDGIYECELKPRKVNAIHNRKVKECLNEISQATVLYSITRDN